MQIPSVGIIPLGIQNMYAYSQQRRPLVIQIRDHLRIYGRAFCIRVAPVDQGPYGPGYPAVPFGVNSIRFGLYPVSGS